MAKATPKNRAVTLYLLFVFSFFALTVQIIRLQIFRSSFFKDLAKIQHYKRLKLEGARGIIYDRRKRILATNLHCYSVFADPAFVETPHSTAKVLAEHTGLSEDTLFARLKKEKRFVWTGRKISLEEKKKISSLNLKGVGFIRERKRFYPQGGVAASVLGFAGLDNKGLEGVELFYDKYLAGKDGWVKVLQDSASREIILSSQVITPQPGADIVLTLDAQIQYWTEEVLEKTVKDFKAKNASAVVMDASGGQIIALANYPSFDPNAFSRDASEYIKNKAVTDMFEPGSVFKIVALLAAVGEKTFAMDDIIFCENGTWKIPGSVLHDWKPYGKLSFEEVFMKSSNIGVVKIVSALGPGTFFDYLQRLEFGKLSGVDLPGEALGSIKDLKRWSKTSSFIIPIGQEISVNLLQLVRTFAVVVNGGYLVRPYMVKSICARGFCKDTTPKLKPIFARQTTEEVKRILVKAVAEGTGKAAALEGRLIGGKTGTAQKYDPQLGRYSPNKYRATFVGFIADLDRPLVIGVTVDEPQKSHFGGVVAAPAFREIAAKIIAYLESQSEFQPELVDSSLN